jgi:hypothetical protein
VAPRAKVVDIEPVGRRGGCRKLMLVLLLLSAAGAGAWYFLIRPSGQEAAPARTVQAIDVHSDVVQEGDSLRVVVDWRLVLPRGPELAESARVEVGVNEGAISQVSTVPANEYSDTLRVPAPAPGQTASGYSCVAPMTRGRLRPERCTPWQFVRPSAGQTKADSAPAGAGRTQRTPRGAVAVKVSRIVVQPDGMQVDPDLDARCATWQRRNPGRSVWVTVNRQAVRECTGPNGKPTVAQFCAFAVLADGRRVKTLSSAKVEYCEELFRQWSGERTA